MDPRVVVLCLLLTILCLARRDANKKFKICCARQKSADPECKHRFCDFDAIHQGNFLFFLNMCRPRNETVSLMWDCASSLTDHTQCCERLNVENGCLAFCNASSSVMDDDLLHIRCLGHFNSIRDCFRGHLETHKNIFGDE